MEIECIEIRNDKFWESITGFIKTDIMLTKLNIIVVGYFPYNKVRIRPSGLAQTYLPVELFTTFLELVDDFRTYPSTTIYICKPIDQGNGICPFALMIKEDYALLGTWDQVVSHDNKTLKIK